ncbi:hypothetical protein LK10_05515 [Sinomonas humi]|uniref:Uncharacterized protein n=1 Tax=Sinomonas humi TaxID=1338436 RepID=A0A0B2AQZ9_9MICC|nr:hypothetical protein LK10_05515 [Sinomonas humi]
MPRVDHDDEKYLILNPVEDAVVAGAYAPFGATSELPCGRWTRFLGEQVDCRLDTALCLRRKLANRPD